MLRSRKLLLNIKTQFVYQVNCFCKTLAYVQGQEPEPRIREYFYYIDHEGMVLNLISCVNLTLI